MFKTITTAPLTAVLLSSSAAVAQDWRDDVPVFRIGLLGGENEADRLREYSCQQDYL